MLTAYSYIRFSDVRQAGGDSERRQVELRETWLNLRPDVELDTTLKMVDRGVGAFRGLHRSDKHCLGQFVKLVENGKVKPGSFLLIENLDRLSREEVHDAVELLLKLTRLGVVVVQLSPVVCEYAYPVEMSKLIIAVVELARGNSESRMKSERVAKAWKAARDRARQTGAVVNLRTLPGWCEMKGGKLRLVPDRAAVLRRLHQWAQDGYGVNQITKKLNDEGVKPWGRASLWSEAVVYRYLTARTVIGEWQPGEGGRGGRERKKVGEPIKDYFPRVIADDCFYATQEAIKKRHGFRGRRGKHVNVFAGLLYDAFSRGKLGYSHEKRGSYVFNYAGRIGEAPLMTYPAEVLERQLLTVLRELDPAVIVGDDSAGAAVLAGEGRLREIDAQLTDIEDQLLKGAKAAVLGKVAEKLELERVAVADQLEKDKRKAAVPSSHSWAVVKDTIDLKDDDVRIKLRSAVRDVVAAVWCVFAGHKTGRYRGWVEIMLHGGAWRTLYIWADTGHKRSKRKKDDGIAGHSKVNADKTSNWGIPAEFMKDVVPELADDKKGPKAAKVYRDEKLDIVAGRKEKVAEFELCECDE
jgi:DNA invertase Pin-like site-specific DNA recombinase